MKEKGKKNKRKILFSFLDWNEYIWSSKCRKLIWNMTKNDLKKIPCVIKLYLLLTTGPAFIFMQLTLRFWTPTGQEELPSWDLLSLILAEASSVQGPHSEASQKNTLQGWSLQTRHSSRTGAAGHALPSGIKHRNIIRKHYTCSISKSADWCLFLLYLVQYDSASNHWPVISPRSDINSS